MEQVHLKHSQLISVENRVFSNFLGKLNLVRKIGVKNLIEATPRETTCGSKNREFEKSRVRIIEFPLYRENFEAQKLK